MGRRGEAVDHALEALRLMSELYAHFPEIRVYANEFANLSSELGYLRLAQDVPAEAREHLERAVPILRTAARDEPSQVMRPVVLAIALARLGEAQRRCNDAAATFGGSSNY